MLYVASFDRRRPVATALTTAPEKLQTTVGGKSSHVRVRFVLVSRPAWLPDYLQPRARRSRSTAVPSRRELTLPPTRRGGTLYLEQLVKKGAEVHH